MTNLILPIQRMKKNFKYSTSQIVDDIAQHINDDITVFKQMQAYLNANDITIATINTEITALQVEHAFLARIPGFIGAGEITGYTAVYDSSNDFNITTGRFTAPVAGIYLFSLGQVNQPAAVQLQSVIALNSTVNIAGARAQAASDTLSCVAVINLVLGDYVSVFQSTGTSIVNGNLASFSGTLIR